MTAEGWLRLALVPAAVWLASLAARRWGHAASGYLGGLPLIGGPITLFLALDHGTGFAARSALFTLAAIAAQAAHLLAVSHAGRRRGWAVSLACGWSAFAAVAIAMMAIPMTPLAALALALAGLWVAWRWLPRPSGPGSPPPVPAAELRLRILAAFAFATLVVWSAPRVGPVASGVLLSIPITGSILPPFTLALHGPDALARLSRGFVVGLSGFTAFFFVIAATLPEWGVIHSFAAAVLAALGAVYGTRLAVRPRR